MNESHVMLGMRSREEEALVRLDRWLSYEVKSGWGIVLMFFAPIQLVITALYLLMIVFVPLIVVELFKARWYKTTAALVVLVLAGYLLPRSITMDPRMITWMYGLGVFVPFYFFCWGLRWVVAEKVAEIKATEAFERMDRAQAVLDSENTA